MPDGISVVPMSDNAKTGLVAATYAPIKQTCPKSCPLQDAGCYAQDSFVGWNVRRLEREAGRKRSITLARTEARMIEELAPRVPKGHPLRLHVSGDCRTATEARIIARACESWPGPVWGYTHAWRDIPRDSWGSISIFASCESVEDAELAFDFGYTPALIVEEHTEDGRRYPLGGRIEVLPCVEQTRGVQCVSCRLCFNEERLYEQEVAIGFAVHGTRKKKALEVIR